MRHIQQRRGRDDYFEEVFEDAAKHVGAPTLVLLNTGSTNGLAYRWKGALIPAGEETRTDLGNKYKIIVSDERRGVMVARPVT